MITRPRLSPFASFSLVPIKKIKGMWQLIKNKKTMEYCYWTFAYRTIVVGPVTVF